MPLSKVHLMFLSKKSSRNTLLSFMTLGCITFISACANNSTSENTDTTADMKTLKGEVFYQERTIIPKGSTLKVLLVDVSKQDAAGEVITFTHQPLYKTPPFAFEIEYNANAIDPKHSYTIQARIEVEGKVRMTTTQHIDPFAESIDANNIQVLVKGVGLSPAAQATKKAPDAPEENEETTPESTK